MVEQEAAASPVPVAGDALPAFDLPATVLGRAASETLLGRPFVLFLFPKADTSGCTQEAREFEAGRVRPGAAAPTVLGLSRDPLPALQRFAAKAELGFPLLSDGEGALVQALGSWVRKSMYGRTYMGIDRSTFLVDATGRIARVWRKVKVPGHAAEALEAASALG